MTKTLTLAGDDRAQSETTGVLLMVVVTFIMGAVIGAAVFNIAGTNLEELPSVDFEYDYDEGAEELTVTHERGSTLVGDRVKFRKVGEPGGISPADWSSEDRVSSGTSIVLSGVEADDTILIIWVSDRKGGGTSIIGQWPHAS